MFALRRHAKVAIAEEPGAIADLDDRVQPERTIVCAACGGSITSPEHRIAVHGAHEHRFMNPAGILFHIGCFAHAIGCTIVGPDSLEYPWFPGFAWRFAMCGSCGQHLGWHFRKEAEARERGRALPDRAHRGSLKEPSQGSFLEDGFFGLILDRLRQPAQDG